MLIGGFLIEKFGKIRMMNFYFMLLIALVISLAYLKLYWTNTLLIAGFMIVYQLLYVFSCIGVFAISMQCCWKKVSASQFTIYMALGNLGRIVGAKLIGPVKDAFTWEETMMAFVVLLSLGWISMQFLHINNHIQHVQRLDTTFLQKESLNNQIH